MNKIMSFKELDTLAEKLSDYAEENTTIALIGDLGTGKTTLTKTFAKKLGVEESIKSPTFNYVLEYFSGRLPLYHFDAYRLEGQDEELGFEEMFEDEGVCVIEWPIYIQDILPSEKLEIQILKNEDESRSMILKPHGEKYEKIVKELGLC